MYISQCHSRTLIILCRTCYVAAEFSKKKGGFEKKKGKDFEYKFGPLTYSLYKLFLHL